MDPDSDPDPAIFASDLQDVKKKFFLLFLILFAYYFLKVHLHNFLKIKVIKNSLNSRNQCFSSYFCLILISDIWIWIGEAHKHMDPKDLDPRHWLLS
jgi:hypothetical protein